MRVSQHAVERFQQRFAPDLGFWAARWHLKQQVANAKRLRQKTNTGEEIYENSGIWFVVKRDPGYRKPMVVTVLYAEDMAMSDGMEAP